MSDVDMFKSQEQCKKRDHNKLDFDSDIILSTPIREPRKKKFQKRKSKPKDKMIVDQDKNFKFRIEKTQMGCFDFNKPFVYHQLEEILRYNLNCFPKNNNIQLIGVHRFRSRRGHYLENHCDGETSIPLDFTVAGGIPDENMTVSVFGALEFNRTLPVFVVKFFRKEAAIVVNKYIETLHEVRQYVPADYVSTISNNVRDVNGKIFF